MFHRHHRWRCTTRVALVLVAALVVTSLPAFAGGPQSPTQTSVKVGIKVSAERAAKAMAPAMKATATARAQETTGATTRGNWAFFKTPLGAVVLATVGVGFGYALYSTQHDRIHSAGKQ